MSIHLVLRCAAFAGTLALAHAAGAQGLEPPLVPSAGPPPTAQKAAPFDLTGYWVAVVSEDWRWRMMTPAKGDYASVPLNAAGRKLADQFNPALYGGATDSGALGGGAGRGTPLDLVPIGRYQTSGVIDCRAYGAAGIMRMPTRLHISWADPNTLKIQTDWGEQQRLLHFVPGRPFANALQPAAGPTSGAQPEPASLQGHSVAVWEAAYQVDAPYYRRGGSARGLGGLAAPIPNPQSSDGPGDLAVVTGNLAPGWLRRNGVPYGAQTREIEHYFVFDDPTGARWFDVTTQIIDPEYLTQPFNTSSDFQKEPDGSQWSPHPCKQVVGEPSAGHEE
jgi:hypothetical protein